MKYTNTAWLYTKRLLLVFLCLFCLSACSAKLAYNFMGFIVKWYIGNYVSLERDQKALVSERVGDFHDWHRRTQLPIYADYMADLQERIQQEQINGKWIHNETDKLQLMLDTSVNYLKPSIIELVASFSDEQSEELLESFAKERKKYRKKNIDISEKKLRDKRRDELVDNLSPFFGKFSKEQKAWIEEWLDQLKPYENLSLTQQETWSEKLKEALDVRTNPEQLTQKLDTIMFYRTDDWNPELEQILDYNQEISYNLIARLINNQSEKQRKKMLKKISQYKEDFQQLQQQN